MNQTKIAFAYNANNHVVAFNGGAAIGTTGTNYYFDGLGQRVKKADYYSSTVFVYDALGNLVAEYATDGQTGAGTSYITTDALGTPRVMTDASGGVRARHDYPPFGEEIGGAQVSLNGGRNASQMYVSDGVRQKFTGKERDNESGLDYFLARDYQSGHGRFTSVDPLLASARITNPQTFNRYSYVANNPLRFTDPLGLSVQSDGGPTGGQDQEEAKKRKQEEDEEAEKLFVDRWEVVIINFFWDKNKPVLSPYDASNSAPPMNSMSGIPGDNTSPAGLFYEFVTGTGPKERQFGPDSDNVRRLRTSPDVDSHRQSFCNGGACNTPMSQYGPSTKQFGLTGWGFLWEAEDGVFRANIDVTRQYVGSFSMTIKETNADDHSTLFVIENTTSRESFLYHMKVGNLQSGMLSDKRQVFWWSERNPCGCR